MAIGDQIEYWQLIRVSECAPVLASCDVFIYYVFAPPFCYSSVSAGRFHANGRQ